MYRPTGAAVAASTYRHMELDLNYRGACFLPIANQLKHWIPTQFAHLGTVHFTEWPGSLAAAQPSQNWA